MRATTWTLTLTLALAPALLAAQDSTRKQVLAGFSAESRIRLEAMLQQAREEKLPTQPMEDRMAEGQAKHASEARVVSATALVLGQMEVAQKALIQGGHEHPSDQEIGTGAKAVARGATSAQLEGLARSAPPEQSLEVALEALTQLEVRGGQLHGAAAGRLDLRGLGGATSATVSTVTSLTGSLGTSRSQKP